MPHKQIPRNKNASAVLNTEPILFKLLTLSRTTTKGVFSAFLNSSTLNLAKAEFGVFFLYQFIKKRTPLSRIVFSNLFNI